MTTRATPSSTSRASLSALVTASTTTGAPEITYLAPCSWKQRSGLPLNLHCLRATGSWTTALIVSIARWRSASLRSERSRRMICAECLFGKR